VALIITKERLMKMLAGISRCVIALLVFSTAAAVVQGQTSASQVLRATTYNSHFPQVNGDSEAWNGITVASNGLVYYVLDDSDPNQPGIFYSYDPKTKQVTKLSDLNAAVGEPIGKAVVQGKSHVTPVEDNGKLYFSTHLGYYGHSSGIEVMAPPPPGLKPYPGGHFVSYDLKSGKFENLAIAPGGEGIITFAMDKQRQRLYGLTWPTGYFLRYDLKTKQLKNLGTKFKKGEIGRLGTTYRSICRRIVVDPRDGSAYFTTGDGTIWKYNATTESIDAVPGVSLRKDYFGQMDPAQHGMAYNWRSAQWDSTHNVIYGINGRSGYLFRFDPDKKTVEVLDRLTSLPAKESGMYDRFDYGYMGFNFGPDGHTLYYLTGAPLPPNPTAASGTATRRGREGAHLITYDTANNNYTDHGLVMLDTGSPASAPQSIAIASDGTVYSLGYVTRNGKRGIELFSFHP
jgi:hypothetical protein